MLLFLFGKDESLAYAKAKNWKDKVLKEKKISESVLFVEKNIDSEDFGTLASDVSMFGDIFAYFIKLKKDEILSESQIVDFINSPNLFALVSNNDELGEMCERLVGDKARNLPKANFVQQVVVDEKKEFFPSHFVEALQKKDKKNSWKILREQLSEKPAEEVFGVCIFAYKTLLAAATFRGNTIQSGVKDFPLNNAKRNLKIRKNGNTEEVENTYFELLKSYTKSRSENIPLSQTLEKWILEN